MSKLIKNIIADETSVLFELEDGTLEEKEISLTNSQINALIGSDYEEAFGAHKIVQPAKKGKVEIDAEVFENMVQKLEEMSQWQSEQQHNQLENSRLIDVLNRRRSGEDTEPTKADVIEAERSQTRSLVVEERKINFETLGKRDKMAFIKNEGDKIRHSISKFGNMTGSTIKARPGKENVEFNNMIFGGGVK